MLNEDNILSQGQVANNTQANGQLTTLNTGQVQQVSSSQPQARDTSLGTLLKGGNTSKYKSVFLNKLAANVNSIVNDANMSRVKFYTKSFGLQDKDNGTSNNDKDITFGTAPGYFLENLVFVYLKNLGYQIDHSKQGSTYDYVIKVTEQDPNDIFKAKEIYVDCKSGLKLASAKVSKNQANGVPVSPEGEIQTDPDSGVKKQVQGNTILYSFIIYLHYKIEVGSVSYSFVVEKADFMPLEYAMTDKNYVTTTRYDQLTKEYVTKQSIVKSIYENIVYSHSGNKEPMTLSETVDYLKFSMNESKRIQLKKFIEQNFTKRGDYVFPKDGNSKCSLHQEYDKGLLRFFAEHGITKIMSAYGNDVPSLGYSDSEKKWYGWSHRAIYGFKVGDKIKKGTCGYEEMKKKGLLNIKTEDQAKEVAKIFAEDVS